MHSPQQLYSKFAQSLLCFKNRSVTIILTVTKITFNSLDILNKLGCFTSLDNNSY